MRYLYLLLIPLLFSCCKKDDRILFEMEYPNNLFDIGAESNIFVTNHYLIRNIASNFDDYLTTFNTNSGDISTINPQNARLSAIFGNDRYNIVQDISVRIYDSDPADYKEIFYFEDVPLNTGGDLNLIPTLVDVTEFVSDGIFNIDVAIVLRDLPPQVIESQLYFDFIAKD